MASAVETARKPGAGLHASPHSPSPHPKHLGLLCSPLLLSAPPPSRRGGPWPHPTAGQSCHSRRGEGMEASWGPNPFPLLGHLHFPSHP